MVEVLSNREFSQQALSIGDRMEQISIIKWVLDIIFIIVGTLIMMYVNRVKEDIRDEKEAREALQKEVSQIKVDYAHKGDIRDMKEEISQRFDRLERLFLESRK